MSFKQSEETKRFLEIVDYLLAEQIISTDADFCRQMGYSAQSFNQFRKQKRNVTVELMGRLLSLFKGNPVYILSGSGPMFIDENRIGVSPRKQQNIDGIVTELLKRTETFKKIIDKQSEHSQNSQKYISDLEKQLKELKKGTHVGREKRV